MTAFNRRELIRLGATSMMLAPTAGCATLWDLFNKYVKLPKLVVRKMNITDMSLTSVSVKFFCDLSNPNPIGVKLDGLDYLLRVSGNELAKGTSPRGIDLRARTAAKTELDLTFQLGNTAAAILDLLGKNVVDYELAAVGKFLAKETGGIDVPFGYKGKMPMPKIPAFNVKGFSPTSVSPSGVGFRIDTAVHNSNDFEIPIDGFAFDIKLDGRKVIDNKGQHGLRVAPNKTETLPVDFHVGLPALGLSLADIAAGKRMNWEVGTSLRSGKLAVPFTHKGTFRFS